MNIYPPQIWKQLLNDAPFQWFLREQAAHSNIHTLATLEEEDGKIEALLDAIGIELNARPEASLKIKDSGSVFVFAVIALRLNQSEIMQQVLDSVGTCNHRGEELYLALRWQSPNDAQIRQIMKYNTPYTKQALVAAFPPQMEENVIQSWLRLDDKPIIIKLLYYIGKNRLIKYKAYANQFYDNKDVGIRLAAAKAGLLLNDEAALHIIKKHATINHPDLRTALLWLFIFADEKTLPSAIDKVFKMQFSPRIQALCIAYSGFHEYIPRLLPIMKDINFAQVAAEAFSLITGVNIVDLDFDANAPEGDEPSAAQKHIFDDQYRRYEEDLPWPDIDLVHLWWTQNQSRFKTGQRYLAGHIINEKNLQAILQTGGQLQRTVASLHLAKLKPQMRCFSTSNKTILQRQELNTL